VGTLIRNGEVFIMHRVDAGETLFAISRRYNARVDVLRRNNPQKDTENLGIGDTLLVPLHVQLSEGNKTVHTVQEGETLFRISRQYGVSVEDIKNWNAIGSAPLAIGQDIIIYHIPTASEEKEKPAIDDKKYVVHRVQQGETLFAISRAYDVSIASLRKLNQLPDERISIGQDLIIRERRLVSSSEVRLGGSDAPDVVVSPTVSAGSDLSGGDEEEEEDDDRGGRRLSRAEALEAEKERIRAIRAAEKKSLSEYEKKSEIGFAAAIEGGIETRKFLALHRSAPVGTIMQIRNEMNDLSVFVRVVGKLPDTGMNDKINIRISRAAYEKLGGINERFPVEITYIE
jgi:LysM repeat protein